MLDTINLEYDFTCVEPLYQQEVDLTIWIENQFLSKKTCFTSLRFWLLTWFLTHRLDEKSMRIWGEFQPSAFFRINLYRAKFFQKTLFKLTFGPPENSKKHRKWLFLIQTRDKNQLAQINAWTDCLTSAKKLYC